MDNTQKLELTNGIDSLFLSTEESIKLELKLNVSPHGRDWNKIGDALYNYGVNTFRKHNESRKHW